MRTVQEFQHKDTTHGGSSQSALLELLGELKLTDVTDRIRVAMETLYQELIAVEAPAFIGAAPFERTPERTTQRNGARPRTLTTIEIVFAGAAWQRCRVHFMRNVLANVPKASGTMVAPIIRTIIAQPDTEHVFPQFYEVVRMLTRLHPKSADMREDAKDDILAFCVFPQQHWRQT